MVGLPGFTVSGRSPSPLWKGFKCQRRVTVVNKNPTLNTPVLPKSPFTFQLYFRTFPPPDLGGNTWVPGVLQAGLLEEMPREIILSTDFQLMTLFPHLFLTPVVDVFIFSSTSSAQHLVNTAKILKSLSFDGSLLDSL
jgi:hypothetical protein